MKRAILRNSAESITAKFFRRKSEDSNLTGVILLKFDFSYVKLTYTGRKVNRTNADYELKKFSFSNLNFLYCEVETFCEGENRNVTF